VGERRVNWNCGLLNKSFRTFGKAPFIFVFFGELLNLEKLSKTHQKSSSKASPKKRP
jgi:hypothetical protein